jgi:hypothetical protein
VFEQDASIRAIALAESDTTLEVRGFSAGNAPFMTGTTHIELPDWSTTRDTDVTLSNVPTAATDSDFAASVGYGYATVSTFSEAAGANAFRVNVPSGISGTYLVGKVTLDYPPEGDNFSATVLRETIGLPDDAYTIDLGPTPRVQGLSVSEVESKRPRLSWSLSQPDSIVGGFGILSWGSTGPAQPAVNWSVVIPRSTTVQMPALPANLAEKVPVVAPGVAVMLGDTRPAITTYDGFRQRFIPFTDLKWREWRVIAVLGPSSSDLRSDPRPRSSSGRRSPSRDGRARLAR